MLRKSNLINRIIVFLFLLLSGTAARAQLEFYAVRTDYLRLVYYDKEHAYVVPHMVRCFENSLRFHRNLFDYTPSGEVTILLQDFDDYGYAGTTTIPLNYITLGIEPFEYVYETCPTNERMNWVMSHELVHVVASDQATRGDKFFRSIFWGKVTPIPEAPLSIFYSYLTNPRRYAPRWYHEGIAVFLETWMAGGIGRAQGGYDEMVFRTMVRDSSYFYDIVGLESEGTTIDFQIGQNAYLYGTRFATYLAYLYGPEKLIEWVRRDKGSRRYFSSQFKKVFGMSLDEEWSNWIRWEHEWQKANLDSIRQYSVTPYRVLSPYAIGSVSRSFFDQGSRKLYAAINYPGEFAHIAAINVDTGEMAKICDIATPALYYVTSLAYDSSTSTLFFTTNNSRQWRDLNAVNVKTGKKRVVLKNNRTGDLAMNRQDRSIWGVQHHNGKSRLVRFLPPYDDWQQIVVMPYGRDIFDIDISPDGKYLSASMVEINGRQYLIRMELEKLMSGDSSFEVLWEFENNAPANFVFSSDGRYLFGTTYYTGTSNICRYDLAKQQMSWVSNCETGFFRPVPVSEDSLIAFRYTGKGFVPIIIPVQSLADVSPIRYLGQAIVEKHPIVTEWELGSPLNVDIDSLITYNGSYSGLGHLKVTSLYPVAEGYKNYAAFGVRLNLMDPVGINGLDLTASYTPNKRLSSDERAHVSFRFRHWPWTFRGTYNAADFYDFFGPTKASRKGYSMALEYNNYLITEKPKLMEYTIQIVGYGGLEKLPDFQNIATSFDEFFAGTAELSYKDVRKTIGAIEPEKGLIWKLVSANNYVKSEIYPRVYTTLDYGILLPVDHSSLWLRTSVGYSFGERDEPFANFYFGGFGNNWVDHTEVNRYREYYSFPGMELNAIAGINYGKAMLELTLPPLRFRRMGIPALYCNWARMAIFGTGIVTNVDNNEHRREFANLGTQLNLKLVIFSSLESTFSAGYAVGTEDGKKFEEELMISLKILR